MVLGDKRSRLVKSNGGVELSAATTARRSVVSEMAGFGIGGGGTVLAFKEIGHQDNLMAACQARKCLHYRVIPGRRLSAEREICVRLRYVLAETLGVVRIVIVAVATAAVAVVAAATRVAIKLAIGAAVAAIAVILIATIVVATAVVDARSGYNDQGSWQQLS